MRGQRGFGLPELLMALMLASFIILLLTQQYSHTKKIYLSIQSKLEGLIDQTMVSDLIRDSARRYGFTPCSPIDYLNGIDRRFQNKPLLALEMAEDDATAFVSFHRMNERFDRVLQFLDSKTILTTGMEKIHPKQSILIADCYHAEVQTVAQVQQMNNEQRITVQTPTAYIYQDPVYVGLWIEETYFINSHSTNKRSLFYRLQHAEELTTMVHTLTAKMLREKGRSLLQIGLGLDDEKPITIVTWLRAL